jgi:hypothetical protein
VESGGWILQFASQFRGGREWIFIFSLLLSGRAGFSRRGLTHSDNQVGQAEERVELMPVFGQAAIAHFPVAEEVLEDMKGMFDKGSHRGFGFL